MILPGDLLDWNGNVIFALINDEKKEVLVVAARNGIQALAGHTYLIANHQHSKIKGIEWRVELLESVKKAEHLEGIRYGYAEEYKASGYTLLNSRMPKYRKRIHLIKNKAVVQLVTAGNRVFTIKTFINYEKAEQWMNSTAIPEMFQLV